MTAVAPEELEATPTELLTAISAWIDGSASYQGISQEAHRVRRCVKTAEEVGEMVAALYGWIGENPRKGVTHTADDVVRELLDVALAALGAIEHLDGNTGTALDRLDGHIRSVASRAARHGLVLPVRNIDYDPGCGNPDCPCATPVPVCPEWMGLDGERWCPRCGWARSKHPSPTGNPGGGE